MMIKHIFHPLIYGFIIGGFLGFTFGIIVGVGRDKNIYKQCRYYDQIIERCVTELGWEKK